MTTSSPGAPPVSNGGALFDLDYMTITFDPCMGHYNAQADQLTSTQEGAAEISSFTNKNVASTAIAGGGTCCLAGAATTSNSAVVGAQGTNSSSGFPFEVDGISGTGETDATINSIIIALPNISGLSFSGSSPATQTGGVGGVNIISQQRLNGNNGFGNPNCVKDINLAPPSVQCLLISFSTGGPNGGGNAFVAGDSVTFNLALNKDPATIIANNLLAGSHDTGA